MAMNARLPMITTCCSRAARKGQAGRGQLGPRCHTRWQQRLQQMGTYGCDLDARRVVCVEAHHAFLQPAASCSCGPACEP
jgi:hypothetical protein